MPVTYSGEPVDTWAALVERIDPAITHDRDWPVHAAAITRAHTVGYDVDQRLPLLAAETPLPPQQPARNLHYRLIGEVPEAATTTSERVNADAAAAGTAATRRRLQEARSSTSTTTDDGTQQPQVQRPDQRWRTLAASIDPTLTASPGWPGLAATLDQAARHGYDVDANLARLAADSPLPENAPALELQYRLLADVDLDTPEPAAPTPPPHRPRREPPPPAAPPGHDRPPAPRR